jgi:phenylalanyl-tRNA synthetase alpha chain
MGEMKNVPNERKKEAGQILNEFKIFVETKYDGLKGSTSSIQDQASSIDLSLPGDELPLGARHPITMMKNRIISIFQRLGFAVAEGPEIEDDFHNFTALNLPEHHPARDMQDTFIYSKILTGCSVLIQAIRRYVKWKKVSCPSVSFVPAVYIVMKR